MATVNRTTGVSNDAGFTLLEVLFAMMLLGIGIMGLQGLAISSARTIGQAELRSEHALIAVQEMEKGLLNARGGACTPPSPSTFTLENGDAVQTTVTPTTATQCTVTVQILPASGALGTYTLTSNVFTPAP